MAGSREYTAAELLDWTKKQLLQITEEDRELGNIRKGRVLSALSHKAMSSARAIKALLDKDSMAEIIKEIDSVNPARPDEGKLGVVITRLIAQINRESPDRARKLILVLEKFSELCSEYKGEIRLGIMRSKYVGMEISPGLHPKLQASLNEKPLPARLHFSSGEVSEAQAKKYLQNTGRTHLVRASGKPLGRITVTSLTSHVEDRKTGERVATWDFSRGGYVTPSGVPFSPVKERHRMQGGCISSDYVLTPDEKVKGGWILKRVSSPQEKPVGVPGVQSNEELLRIPGVEKALFLLLRSLGGTTDTVLFPNREGLENFRTHTSASSFHKYSAVFLSPPRSKAQVSHDGQEQVRAAPENPNGPPRRPQ